MPSAVSIFSHNFHLQTPASSVLAPRNLVFDSKFFFSSKSRIFTTLNLLLRNVMFHFYVESIFYGAYCMEIMRMCGNLNACISVVIYKADAW